MTPAQHTATQARLTKPYEYYRVYKEGRLLKSPHIWVYLLRHATDQARLGVSVSKRVQKKATDRNRLKRIIKGWFLLNKGIISGGYDMVVVAKKPVKTDKTGAKDLCSQMRRLLEQLADPS